MTTDANRVLRALVVALAVGLAYMLCARLALLLAIPPGYATAFWPAAGIALLGVLRYGRPATVGTWVGSTFANLLTATSDGFQFGAVLLAATIGLGAAVQACVGALLVRRARVDMELTAARDVLSFICLGGPAACVVSATVGTLSLCAMGVMSASAVPYSWLTWWVGDTIGVVLVGVGGLCLWPHASASWRKRRLTVALPMLGAAAAMVFCYVRFSDSEQHLQDLTFDQRHGAVSQALVDSVDNDLRALVSLQAFWRASEFVDPEEFRTFVHHMLEGNTTIQALEWLPRVRAEQRDEFERNAVFGSERRVIFEHGPDGARRPAGARDDWFPIAYAEPLAGNERVIGYDLASDPVRRETLLEAERTGRATASAQVRLLQERGEQFGFVVAAPVFRDSPPPVDPEARRASLRGYLVAVYRAGDLLMGATRGLASICDGLEIELRDVDVRADMPWLAVLRSGALVESPLVESAGPHREMTWRVAGRDWQLRVKATPEYLAAQSTWGPWAFLTLALSGSCLLGMFLLFVTGQSHELQHLVAERTAALDDSNRELATRVAELDTFTSVASHDLQAPLRRLITFCGQLRQDLGADLSEDAKVDLHHIEQSSTRMQTLVRDLLSLSRIGKGQIREQRIDLGACIDTVVQGLSEVIARNDAVVTRGPLPTVQGDPLLLGQLFQNLIENGIKYRRADVSPEVRVECVMDDEWCSVRVSDNGIGIPPRYRAVVFEPFRRLHGQDEYEGSGIGLSICRTAVERHGGTIRVDESERGGSMFEVVLPVKRVLAAGPSYSVAEQPLATAP